MFSEKAKRKMEYRYQLLASLNMHGTMRKGEISDIHNIRKASITELIAELLEVGIIKPIKPGNNRSAFCLDDSRYFTLSCKLKADELILGRVFLDGRVEDFRTVPLQDRLPECVLQLMARELKGLLQERSNGLLGIGLALPGSVDSDTGTLIFCNDFRSWQPTNFKEALQNELGRLVIADNSVRCQLWSAGWFDRLWRGTENLLYVELDKSITCSILSRGQRVTGKHFAAGEIAHWRCGNEERICHCGKVDCLESYCNLDAICNELKKINKDWGFVSSADDIAALAGKNPEVQNVLDRVMGKLGQAVCCLIHALDPELLLIGTANKEFSQLLVNSLSHYIRREVTVYSAQQCGFFVPDPIDLGALKGAAALVIDHCFFYGKIPPFTERNDAPASTT